MFKLSTLLAFTSLATSTLAAPLEKRAPSGIPGFDVSHYQGSVDMKAQASKGAKFVIIKATEGTDYIDQSFSANYDSATSAGLIRGGYHFAHPDSSSGATQATYFLAHGGGWSNDGRTLPGMLDIEYNPNGATCYGLSQSAMVNWITDFVNTYHAKTTRYPLIYSTADWWSQCTGNSAAFSKESPLVLAHYTSASSPSPIPGGWGYETFWQWADSGTFPGDQDVFNGSLDGLKKIASG